jgi:hypothetical protein
VTGEWVQVDLAVVEKYGADAAVLLGLIVYRCRPTGGWCATQEDMADQSRLTVHRVKAALRVLRDGGLVEGRRADRFHATLTWAVDPATAEKWNSIVTRSGETTDPEKGNSSVSSYTEDEELFGLVPTDAEVPAAPAARTTRKARRATTLPPDFAPTPAHWELARSLGVDLAAQGPQFVDYHTAKGSMFKDWDAALRTWVRKAATFASASNVTPIRRDHVPSTSDVYDPAAAALLPPPRTSPW